jgi:hypothetical protein
MPKSSQQGKFNELHVMRNSWSSYYAMAVIELGQAVADRLKN